MHSDGSLTMLLPFLREGPLAGGIELRPSLGPIPAGKEDVMSERKKRAGKISGSVQGRIKKLEALLEEVAARLGQVESQLRKETARARALESKISSQIAKAQGRTGEMSGGQTRPASFIALEEGCAVDLEGWERKMDDKYALLSAKERELKELEKKIYGELEKLLDEIKQRDLLLAAREVELRSLKQGLASRLDELEGLVTKRSGGRKAARLVSFLVDIGKKH